MGQAKQLLYIGERTVLERTLENVRGSNVDEIVLVLGCFAERIQSQLSDSLLEDLKIVVNPDYEQGMASSLRAGLSAVDQQMDAALIVLADQPFVRSETIDRIIGRHHLADAEIVIPFYRGSRGNPVLLNRSVFPEAEMLEGDTGCRAIFGNHADGIAEVEVDDAGILLDINSRDDYEGLRVTSK
jgi:molybdenum cofactor cytidylyltransferase